MPKPTADSPDLEGFLALPWLLPAGTASATKLLPELEKDTVTVPSPLSEADTPVGAEAGLGEGLEGGLGTEAGDDASGGEDGLFPGKSKPEPSVPEGESDPKLNCVSFRRAPMSTRPGWDTAMQDVEH